MQQFCEPIVGESTACVADATLVGEPRSSVLHPRSVQADSFRVAQRQQFVMVTASDSQHVASCQHRIESAGSLIADCKTESLDMFSPKLPRAVPRARARERERERVRFRFASRVRSPQRQFVLHETLRICTLQHLCCVLVRWSIVVTLITINRCNIHVMSSNSAFL